jgi:hypothetical protein
MYFFIISHIQNKNKLMSICDLASIKQIAFAKVFMTYFFFLICFFCKKQKKNTSVGFLVWITYLLTLYYVLLKDSLCYCDN